MNNFKIGIDARFLLRPLRGMPLYVLRLCQNLPALARNYQFIYFINKGFEHNDTPENYLPRIKEIETQHPNVTFVNFDDDAEIKWEQIILPRLLKEYKVDLLHMPGNRICFFPGVPIVVTLHDVMEYKFLLNQKYPLSWHKNGSIRMLLHHLRKRLYASVTYKWGFARAEKIISVSNYSANDIVKTLKIDSNKISTIHHGVDSDYLIDFSLPLDERQFTLMLGGDSFQKNPEAAIACWAEVPPEIRQKYPLKIIGFCGSDSSPIMQAVKKYNLENLVQINGWVSQEEMVEAFKKAAVFLFPSRYEGFGFPLIQAMACGTPVISTNRSSIPEVLGPVGFQFDPDDHAGMAAGIGRVLSDPALWAEQSASGAQRAGSFTWENSAQAHLDVYSRILGQSSD